MKFMKRLARKTTEPVVTTINQAIGEACRGHAQAMQREVSRGGVGLFPFRVLWFGGVHALMPVVLEGQWPLSEKSTRLIGHPEAHPQIISAVKEALQ